MPRRILVVEDEGVIMLGTILHLKSFGYEIVGTFQRGEDAVEHVTDLEPDLLLMDVKLAGGIDGIETVRQIHKKMDVPVIYLSAYSNEKLLEEAKATNPFTYIVKPFNDDELPFIIESAIDIHQKEKLIKKIEAYEKVLYNLNGMVYLWGAEGSVTVSKVVLEKITGFKRNELKRDDKHFLGSLILEADHENVVNVVKDSFNSKKSFKVNYRIKNKNGKVKNLHEISKPITGSDGKIQAIGGVIFDVTE